MTVLMPANEIERLQTLHAYGLLDSPPEAVFDEIVALAGYVFNAPIALISLLDESRVRFKSCVGIQVQETPRESSFCAYAVLDPEGLVVPDALADPRFAKHPLVLGTPSIRFYAGVPLITREGHALGTLCVSDTKPRPCFDFDQKQALQTLGRHLMAQMELRYSSAFLARALNERRQAELEQQNRLVEHDRELNRLTEMKDRFVTMLAHELRNPLASILNAIELLRSPEPQDALEIVEAQVKHLSRLIEDLMDLSRVTRGKIVLKKVILDSVQAVHAAARAAQPLFAKGGQRFVTDWPKEPLWVLADPVRLEQIVSNLLVNAAKFTEPGKKISLSIQRQDDHAVLRVKDEGIGIPPEMHACIFEPFVQLDGSQNRGGLGVGLPLVQQLIRLHNGRVELRSDGTQCGSEFIVRIPLAKPSPAQGAEAPKKSAPPAAQTRHRILIVEDNPDLGMTLRRLLSHWGHEADLTASGLTALEKALEFRPDIAIIDIMMPKMDGYAVAQRLCSHPELAGLRLVAMSGYGEESDQTRAFQAGFHDFLLKPVDPSLLRKLLEP